MKEMPTEMLDISNTHLVDSSYIEQNSIFSSLQTSNFLSTLQSSFDLFIELCINSPYELKKIIYLADDILKVAKFIPSYLNKTLFVDMRVQVCYIVHQIASFAPQIEIGMPVNIDSQLLVIQERHA